MDGSFRQEADGLKLARDPITGGSCRGTTAMAPKLDPKRTVAELKFPRALTRNADGAQRVAFTETCDKARKRMRKRLARLPVATSAGLV